MDLSTLPVFGPCSRCGNSGTDADGDARAGTELIMFQGKYLCQVCISEVQDHNVDLIKNRHEYQEEKFRHGIGVRQI